MKGLKFLFLVVVLNMIVVVKAQNTHNYFTSEVYPGLYAQITFGNNYILFSYPPNQAVRLNYAQSNNGWNYYSSGNFVVMMSSDALVMSTAVNGRVVKFTYVGPVNSNPYNYNGGSSVSTETTRRMKCHFCNGTGRVRVNDHIPQYGFSSVYVYEKCGECGEEYNSTTTNHYHTNCSKCFGKGYIER